MDIPAKQTFTENGEHVIGSLVPGTEFMFEWDGVPDGAVVALQKISPTGVRRPYKTVDNAEVLNLAAGDTAVCMTNGRGIVLLNISGGGANMTVTSHVVRLYKDVD